MAFINTHIIIDAAAHRLRAHHRAPVRAAVGQGGHACELENCPHCSKRLVPGLPHVGCARGLAAPKQAAKRKRVHDRQEVTKYSMRCLRTCCARRLGSCRQYGHAATLLCLCLDCTMGSVLSCWHVVTVSRPISRLLDS